MIHRIRKCLLMTEIKFWKTINPIIKNIKESEAVKFEEIKLLREMIAKSKEKNITPYALYMLEQKNLAKQVIRAKRIKVLNEASNLLMENTKKTLNGLATIQEDIGTSFPNINKPYII